MNQNEFNRTEVQDRQAAFEETLLKFKNELNQSGDVRILDTIDSLSKSKSYFNTLLAQNQNRLARTTNGIYNAQNLVHLQVKGKNQLFKEIEET